MAKALLGGVGRPDPHLTVAMRRLQQRVVDLEAELVRLQAENETLHAALSPLREEVVVLTSTQDLERAQSRKQPAMV